MLLCFHFDWFQFHKGTIKTQTPDQAQPQDTSFQFHKGTIKTSRKHWKAYHHKNNFNSIKVRLKRGVEQLMTISYWYFNSIKVRLKQYLPKRYAIMNTNFNSIKVRLKHYGQYPYEHNLTDFNSIKVRLKHCFWHINIRNTRISIP